MFKGHIQLSITNANSIIATTTVITVLLLLILLTTLNFTTAHDITTRELRNTKRFETNITFMVRAFIKQLRPLHSFMSHDLFKKRIWLKLSVFEWNILDKDGEYLSKPFHLVHEIAVTS